MNNLFHKLKLHPFLACLVLIILVFTPAFTVGWALVDDGKSAEIATLITRSLAKFDLVSLWNNLLEPDSGRFRPAYWIYQWLTFLIAGKSSMFHYIIHLMVFLTDSILIYKLVNKSGYKWSGVIASIFFILDYRLLENWYRLGPQEPIQLLMLLLSLYFYIKFRDTLVARKLIWSLIFLIFAFLYKETTIAYIAIPFFFIFIDFISGKKELYRFDFYYLIVSIILAIFIRFYPSFVYSGSGYSSLYQLSFSSVISNTKNYTIMLRSGYSPLMELLFLVFLIRFLAGIKNSGFLQGVKINTYSLIFLTWFFAFFTVQLPWGFTIGRYLQVALVGLFGFMAVELSIIIKCINSYLKNPKVIKRADIYWAFALFKIVVLSLFTIILFYQAAMSVSYIAWVTKVSNFNSTFIKATIANTPPDGSVYLNADYIKEPPLELYKEIGWHFQYLYNRGDIKYDYLPLVYSLNKGDIILVHTAKPLFSIQQMMQRNNLVLVDSKEIDAYSVVFSAPLGLIKEIPKTFIDISREDQQDFKLLNKYFAVSKYTYKWEVYRVD